MRRTFFLGVIIVGILSANTSPGARLLRQPDISKEGIAYIYGGDLWTAPRTGGAVRRLTATPEAESFPKFSPDGKSIVFTRLGDKRYRWLALCAPMLLVLFCGGNIAEAQQPATSGSQPSPNSEPPPADSVQPKNDRILGVLPNYRTVENPNIRMPILMLQLARRLCYAC